MTAATSSPRPISGVAGAGRLDGHSGRRRRRLERGILPQDRALELLESRGGLDAELLDERAPGRGVGLERLRLAAGAVERKELLAAQPLAERMLPDERLELGDQLRMPAERELRLETGLDRAEPLLLEPCDLGSRKRGGEEVPERRAAPERQSLAQVLRSGGGTRRASAGDEPPEPLEVELPGLDPQAVAGAARLQALRARARAASRGRRPGSRSRPSPVAALPRGSRRCARGRRARWRGARGRRGARAGAGRRAAARRRRSRPRAARAA